MCKISLNFSYFYDREDTDIYDIKQQLRDVEKEILNKVNYQKNFKYCEVEKCGVGKLNICPKYHYTHFLQVYTFTLYWSVQKPNYRVNIHFVNI